MLFSNEPKTQSVFIHFLGSEMNYVPSFRIEVKTSIKGPSDTELLVKSKQHIWIEEAGLKRFLLDMEKLEETRQGEAVLQSMSPKEFELTISNIDGQGHLGLRFLMIYP